MLTRIEIDGFKTFENFGLDLQPFSAIVGPNASGKSNLFDAIRFLSLLAQHDVRTAMQGVRGQPEELFRRTEDGLARQMRFAVEVLLDAALPFSLASRSCRVWRCCAARAPFAISRLISAARSRASGACHGNPECNRMDAAPAAL